MCKVGYFFLGKNLRRELTIEGIGSGDPQFRKGIPDSQRFPSFICQFVGFGNRLESVNCLEQPNLSVSPGLDFTILTHLNHFVFRVIKFL